MMKFQSPCAGNMFGKPWITRVTSGTRSWPGFNPRVRGTCLVSFPLYHTHTRARVRLFQSPCAGNMFGKCLDFWRKSICTNHIVSIPVCGEHVW